MKVSSDLVMCPKPKYGLYLFENESRPIFHYYPHPATGRLRVNNVRKTSNVRTQIGCRRGQPQLEYVKDGSMLWKFPDHNIIVGDIS